MIFHRAVAESEAIFVSKAKDLAYIQFRFGSNLVANGSVPQVTEASIREWLSKVTHNPAGKHRKLRRYATAYYVKQQIIYNPLFLEKGTEQDLLDTILHELGHLFTYHFIRNTGHGIEWRMVGTIVGYAEVGSASAARRVQYRSFAGQQGTVEVSDATLGRIGAVEERNQSSIESPVRLVWRICEQYPTSSRAAVIAHLISLGVNRNTASTQYYHWRKANGYRKETW